MITRTEGGDKILVVFETECIVRDRPRSLVINSDPVLPGALSVEFGKEVHIELVWLIGNKPCAIRTSIHPVFFGDYDRTLRNLLRKSTCADHCTEEKNDDFFDRWINIHGIVFCLSAKVQLFTQS